MSDLSITGRSGANPTSTVTPAGDAAGPAAERVAGQIRDFFDGTTHQVEVLGSPETGTVRPEDLRHVRNEMVHARLSEASSARIEEAQRRAQPRFEVTSVYPEGERGSTFELTFDRPMTERDVAQRLYQGGKLPAQIELGSWSNAGEITLVPVGKSPARVWKLSVPTTTGGSEKMNPGVWDTIDAGAARHSSRVPPFVPEASKQAILAKQPPKPGDPRFTEVRNAYPAPRQHVTTWREGAVVSWYDSATGAYGAYREHATRGSDIYNRDMRHYVQEQGLSPTEAGRRYGTQWESLNKQMIGAFGTAFDDRHGWEILLHGIVGHEGE